LGNLEFIPVFSNACSLDCKTGDYNLEGSSLKGERLIKIILLTAIAYSSAVFQGTEIKKMQVQRYVSRRSEPGKKYRRRREYMEALAQDGQQ
jgi:hypothetical protein